MKITYGPCDKAYRDHWLKTDGFHDTCEYFYGERRDSEKAKMTDAQRTTVEKLIDGSWTVAVDESGNVTIVVK